MNFSENPDIDPDQSGVLANLSRRQFLNSANMTAAPSQMRFMEFKFNRLKALGRTFLWLSLLLNYTIAAAGRSLFRRDQPNAGAHWLRQAFEKRGGSFVKLGIHLSMRLDFLPWEYGVELSKMTDRMDPFPVEEAIREIEHSIQKPLGSVFSVFDPAPIASSSTACIYQAKLMNGSPVIVKVRRPGICEQFMTDLQAFDWLLGLAEWLTIFQPGFTKSMRGEFRAYLLEELDFLNEARRQDSFRRTAADSGKNFFTSPFVYLEYSGETVIVEEFVSGMWLWELLAAVEHQDAKVLAYAQSLNIDPKKVAKRLLWARYWSIEENLFYSPNAHPDNIIISQNSVLNFIDFAATASLNRSKRQAMQQILYYMKARDPQNMARACLLLMEPLPPIDLIELTQELETYNLQLLYNLESVPESLSWPERTSAIQWIGIIQLARKNNIVIDIQVLQLLRSTLLTESSAVRLFHRIDLMKVYEKFEDFRADRAGRKATDRLIEQLDGKMSERLIIRMDRIAYTLQGLFFRTRHLLTIPSVNFSALMNKWSFAINIFFRFLVSFLVLTGGGVAIYLVGNLVNGPMPLDPGLILRTVITNPIFQTISLLLLFVNGRSALFRLEDKEV